MKKTIGIITVALLIGAVALFSTVKSIQKSDSGIQINLKDDTGYWLEF